MTIAPPELSILAERATAAMPLGDPTLAYLGSLSPAGREAMVKRLRAVAKLLPADGGATPPWEAVPWHELRFQHVAFIRQRLLERGAAPATVNLTLAALRGIARYARNLDLLSAEEHDRIRDVKPAGGTRLPAGRAATRGELLALVEACAADPTPAGTRDAALLAVLYVGGSGAASWPASTWPTGPRSRRPCGSAAGRGTRSGWCRWPAGRRGRSGIGWRCGGPRRGRSSCRSTRGGRSAGRA